MKLVFDIETDGLDYTKIWLLVAKDIKTGEEYIFSDFDKNEEPLDGFKPLFDKAEVLIGHNIISFDMPALKKITGWTISNQRLIDTMLLSQLNNFPRLKHEELKRGRRGVHALDTWGQFLNHTKPDDPSWERYSAEMKNRCVEDVRINAQVYDHLLKEYKAIKKINKDSKVERPDYLDAVNLENSFAIEIAKQEQNGWLFDRYYAAQVLMYIRNRMSEIEVIIEPKLKDREVFIDKEPRKPKVLKNGRYDRVTRDHFGFDTPEDGKPPEEYQRSIKVETDLGNNKAVIELLTEQGWKPTEYNWKNKVDPVTGYKTREKGSPKITEDSFEKLGDKVSELGQMIGEWRMLRSRRGFIKNQLKNIRKDGRVVCGGFVIGTNTFRMRHRGIVNVPGAYAPLGAEIRDMYTSPEGRKIVSADSAGNQLRGFCHYLNNNEVSDAVAFGDIHTRNAELVGVPRNIVKNLTYALLFGAGDKKLADTAGVKANEGADIREKMIVAYPGFDVLVESVEDEWNDNIRNNDFQAVTGLDGRLVFCEKHKAFNALLQAFEAITMKAACVQAGKMIEDEGLDAKLVAHYHDEMSYEVIEKDAERVAEILAYSLGPYITEKYKLNIPMKGDPEIGNTWKDVH